MASTTRFLVRCWPGCDAPFDDSKTAYKMAADFDLSPSPDCIVPHKVIEEVIIRNSGKKDTIIEQDITDARRIQRIERILIGAIIGAVAGYLLALKFLN